jgi:predicted DNA-binding transcriptional regulator AlpA
MRDYRTLPVDVLRDFARTQTEITSIRKVADDVGIGRSTLHKFILGRTAPQPRVLRLIGLWYLEGIDRAHDLDAARPYSRALDTLIAETPDVQRDGTAAKVLTDLESGYTDAGAPLPRWLQLLRTWRADQVSM